jgi:ankyrin repeat protein
MSNGFFSGGGGNDKERKNAIKSMFRHAMNHNNRSVKYIVDKYKLNLNSEECWDQYGNNLLHIAVRSNNYELVKDLILIDIDRNKKNNYATPETPFDIAMKNYNETMVKLLSDTGDSEFLKERIESLKVIIDDLTNDLESVKVKYESLKLELERVKRTPSSSKKRIIKLETENRILTDKNRSLTIKNSNLTSDLRETCRNLKRKSEDCEELGRTVKKQKKDITDLRKIVDTLRDSIKK